MRRILQIFSRYGQFGGEEGSVTRIGDVMQGSYDVEYFFASSADLFRAGLRNKLKLPGRLFYNREITEQLRRYQKMGRFDLWQVHNVFPGMSPGVYHVAEKLGVPVVQYLHNYRLSCANGFFLNHGQPCQRCIHGNFLPALETGCWHNSKIVSGTMGAVLLSVRWQHVFGKIARFIAISHRQKELHVAMGIDRDRIDVIPHFYQPDSAPPPPCPQGHALFVGRLSVEKGVMPLLRAWQLLRRNDRQLYIVGEGPEREPLERFCQEHGLANVVFTGFLKGFAMQEIWKGAAFSIVPSIWEEPFGMVVLESWARQRPVIAHRLGALPEIISHHADGWICEPNSESLAAALEGYFSDPGLLVENGRAGFEKVLRDYNQQIWLDRLRQTYAQLIPS